MFTTVCHEMMVVAASNNLYSTKFKIDGHDLQYFHSDPFIVNKKGAAFLKLGSFEVIDPDNPSIIRSYDLTAIERSLWHSKRLNDSFALDIENSLNDIYNICGKERRHFLSIL